MAPHLRRGSTLAALAFASTLAACASDTDNSSKPTQAALSDAEYVEAIQKTDSRLAITADEGYAWNKYKADGGPTYAGSDGWKRFMAYIEPKFKEYGLVDVQKLEIPYTRYFVDDYPVDNGIKKLVSDGRTVTVAGYGMNSGFTPDAGLTLPMVYFDPLNPPTTSDVTGKILVIATGPESSVTNNTSFQSSFTFTDYVWRATLGNEDPWPLFQYVPPSVSSSYHGRWEWNQVAPAGAPMPPWLPSDGMQGYAIAKGAAGMIVVYDLAPDNAKGLTQRSVFTTDGKPTSPQVNIPTLTLDRVAGAQVLLDAKAGKTATLTLKAKWVPNTIGYAYAGFLPGKDYGTAADERIVITTHTDAMSLIEENGALGVLAIVKYYGQVPQRLRPRTLMVYLDARHFMPGAESGWPQYDWFTNFPAQLTPVVGLISMEHMGGMETVESGAGGNTYGLSGRPEQYFVGIDANPWAYRTVVAAAQDNAVPRLDVKSNTGEVGVNGGYQGSVRAPLNIGSKIGKYGIGCAGNWPGNATQMFAQIGIFDRDVFRAQANMLTQIVGGLMSVDKVILDASWSALKVKFVKLADSAFVTPASAATQRAALVQKWKDMFTAVEYRADGVAKAKLASMKTDIASQVVAASQADLDTAIDALIAKLN